MSGRGPARRQRSAAHVVLVRRCETADGARPRALRLVGRRVEKASVLAPRVAPAPGQPLVVARTEGAVALLSDVAARLEVANDFGRSLGLALLVTGHRLLSAEGLRGSTGAAGRRPAVAGPGAQHARRPGSR